MYHQVTTQLGDSTVDAASRDDHPAFSRIDDDYLTITLLAAGLDRMLKRREGRGPASDGLLPAPWRVAFTRLWWRCHGQGAELPTSDLEVMQWCAKPFATWELRLHLSDTDLQQTLVLHDELSTFAEQAARMTAVTDVEAEWVENGVFRAINTVASFNGGDDDKLVEAIYAKLRRLLIDTPVLSDLSLLKLEAQLPAKDGNGQTHLRKLIDTAYDSHPASDRYRYIRCKNCENTLASPDDRCPTSGCTGDPTPAEMAVNRRVYELHRAARRFIRDPGLVETRIFDRLELLVDETGYLVEVTAYPGLDTLDVLVEFLSEDIHGQREVIETWGIDAKDQLSARLLGRKFSWPKDLACDRRFLALPLHRARQFNYVADLKAELEGRVQRVEVVDEEALLTMVKKRAQELCK